jgi:hypothetical protein
LNLGAHRRQHYGYREAREAEIAGECARRSATFNANAFNDIKLDLKREFKEAIRLALYKDADVGIAELNRRRTIFRPSLPRKAISTVHKAKGLQKESVLIVPCDQQHFGELG